MRFMTSEHWARKEQLFHYAEEYQGDQRILAYGIIIDKDSPVQSDNFCTWFDGEDYSEHYYTFGLYKSAIKDRWDYNKEIWTHDYEDRPSDDVIIKALGEHLVDRFPKEEWKYITVRFMLMGEDGKPYRVEGEREWTIEA